MDKTKGGSREGAGRPTIGNGARIKTGVSLDPDHFAALENENTSEIINAALEITLPVLKGNEDEARQSLENFINERK